MTENNEENDNHFDENQDGYFQQNKKNIFIKIVEWCKRKLFAPYLQAYIIAIISSIIFSILIAYPPNIEIFQTTSKYFGVTILLSIFISIMLPWFLYRLLMNKKFVSFKKKLKYFFTFTLSYTFFLIPRSLEIYNTIDFLFGQFLFILIFSTIISYPVDFCYSLLCVICEYIKGEFNEKNTRK